MTKQQALEEARKRWGEGGYADQCAVRADLAYQVGVIEQGFKRVRGTGGTWEEAFDLASDIEDFEKYRSSDCGTYDSRILDPEFWYRD